MKKTRILAWILTLIMLVSLLPMNALAMTVTIVGSVYKNNDDKLAEEPLAWGEIDVKEDDKKVTISTKDYADILVDTETGKLYEIVGLHILNNKVMDKLEKTNIGNSVSSVTIPAAPQAEDYDTEEEYEAAYKKWADTYSDLILLAYGPHIHDLTDWYGDATNHWQHCRQCKEKYINYNWHTDKDEDDVCDKCGMAIVYYNISVPEVEGIKSVTLEGPKEDSTAAYNDKITITVEAEEGYKITDVRVYKIREDGSKAQIVREIVEFYKVYETVMQNFDCEIVVTCVKK